jgi:hypothetical protein
MTSEQPSPNSLPEQPDLRGAVPADGQPAPADRETAEGPQAVGSGPEAAPAPAEQGTPTDPGAATPAYREVTVRRAPKFIPFMAVGAILGFLAALVIAYTGAEDPTLTRESVLGFFTVVLALPGLLLAALLVLIFDRRSVKRAERARAERTPDEDAA